MRVPSPSELRLSLTPYFRTYRTSGTPSVSFLVLFTPSASAPSSSSTSFLSFPLLRSAVLCLDSRVEHNCEPPHLNLRVSWLAGSIEYSTGAHREGLLLCFTSVQPSRALFSSCLLSGILSRLGHTPIQYLLQPSDVQPGFELNRRSLRHLQPRLLARSRLQQS